MLDFDKFSEEDLKGMLRLFLIVIIFSVASGGLLAIVKTGTQERIELQQLEFIKGPTIKQILKDSSNDPLSSRFKLTDNGVERDFFIGEFNGKKEVIAFESFGQGFDGAIGVIVAVNVVTDEIVGVGVTTHSETPGVGSRAKTDLSFVNQFKGMPLKAPFKVTSDGGQINAISGATVTSRGVCAAVTNMAEIYSRLKRQIISKL